MKKISLLPVSRLQIITVLFFAIIYSLISLVNHYNFRTYCYDLGLQNKALYDYSHFRINNGMLLLQPIENCLGEHFEIFQILFFPFRYLFGTYTLLLLQIIFVLFGGFGIYKYIKEISSDKKISFLAQLHFYFFYGIYSTLSFDFHNNVIGAMFVPWFFYFFHLKKWKWATLFFVLMISTKENMPLWMAFVCAGIFLLYRKDKTQRIWSVAYCLLSVVYFVFVVNFVMPALANQGEVCGQIQNNYSVLGSSLSEMITTIFSSPIYVIEMLFINHTGNPFGDYYKMESWIFVLFSGGILFFVRPQFFVMILPVFAQKMFHNDYLKWGLADHYSIEFAPICSIGAFFVLSELSNPKWKKYLSHFAVLLTLILTLRSFDNTYTYFDHARQRIYQISHYQRDYDVAEAHRALNLIPKNAKVSAQSPFVPHLAFRDFIYQFPVTNDAEYMVFSYKEKFYPLTQESFMEKTRILLDSDGWEKIYKKNDMLILKRREGNPPPPPPKGRGVQKGKSGG